MSSGRNRANVGRTSVMNTFQMDEPFPLSFKVPCAYLQQLWAMAVSSIQKASRWSWELAVLDSSKTTFRGRGEEDCRKTHLYSHPRPKLHSETPSLNKTNQMGWGVCLGIDINRNCMELMNWLVSGTTGESMLASLCVCVFIRGD